MNKNFYEKLGSNIKKLRKEKKLTQQALADKMGKGLNFTGKIEIAFSKPSLDTLINIADALGITVSELTNFKN
jgi:transcriptional regulator with XRE-family HTH domain